MKKLMFVMMAVAICIGTVAAKSNATVEKSVPVTPFDKVSFTSGITVKFTQGSKHQCVIIASPKDMKRLKAEVKDRTLNIYVEGEKKKIDGVTFSSACLSDDVVVKVTSPSLNKVECVGSGDFTATNDIKSEDVVFDIAGSGNVKLKTVSANKLSLTITGSGEIDLQQANAGELHASVVGSGDIEIDNVSSCCTNAKLSVMGSGNIDAKFSDCRQLECKVAGQGEIELKGRVVNYRSSIFGTGEIKKGELVITGDCRESDTNNPPQLRMRQRTPNNTNAEP